MTAFHPDHTKHLQDELDAARAECRKLGATLGKIRCVVGLEGTEADLVEATRALVAQRDTHWRLMEQAMRWLRDSPDTVKLSEQMAEEVVKAPPGFFDPPETPDV